MKLKLILAAAVALAACTPEIEATRAAEDDAVCRGQFATVKGTPEYSQCMMAQVERRDRQSERVSGAFAAMGQGFTNAANNSNRLNCTSTPGYGGTVTTNCY